MLRAALASVAVLGALAGLRSHVDGAVVEALAGELRAIYAEPGGPGERWGHRPRPVRLHDGREVAREDAHRDAPEFVSATRRLLASMSADDAPLGAWLLATAPAERQAEAELVLIDALEHRDPRVVFEAARGLARFGGLDALSALCNARRLPAELRASFALAAARIAAREGRPRCDEFGGAVHDTKLRRAPEALAAAFKRGVNWWHEAEEHDGGTSSFQRLASLGVQWVSIHSWDARQRGIDRPDFAPSSRFSLAGLDSFVRNAHAAGIKVMVKPHLEMRRYELTAEERRVLRSGDEEKIRCLRQQIEVRLAKLPPYWHNQIEMKNERDWRAWFANYESYLLDYARRAREAGADMFCVGRELDRSVILRESDWRRLIARVRAEFPGPLTYSANFDTYAAIGFWDALDAIGISAYFALSPHDQPATGELELGWDRALAGLEQTSRRFGRPVLLTEVGVPSLRGGARAPWREADGAPDVLLQARYYEAALRSAAKRPWIAGTFFWLWEGTTQPPFRDASFTIQNKPAADVMGEWYRRRAKRHEMPRVERASE